MWASYHIFVEWPGEDLLLTLLRLLERGVAQRELKRYFFIRYSEGGYHFRLRLQNPSEAIQNGVWAACAGARVDTGEPYSRQHHYFGESPLSVYAELLNAQTSTLALACLANNQLKRTALTSLISAQILEFYRRLGGNVDELIAAGRSFAETQLRKGNPQIELPLAALKAPKLLAKADTELFHPAIGRCAKLLVRLSRLTGGIDVAAHALHLFHNKLGLGFYDEWITMRLAGAHFSNQGESR